MPIRQHYGLSPDLLSAKHEGQQLLKQRGDYLMPAFKLLKLALMVPLPRCLYDDGFRGVRLPCRIGFLADPLTDDPHAVRRIWPEQRQCLVNRAL